jgi:methylenetetrahydrofolate dehydrogenase (NADP+)/methenyltetrahydrofolate cyclohydrolase
MAKLLDGKALALQMQAEIAEGAARLKAQGTIPALAVILVGEYPPSLIYVRNKETACERVGIATHTDRLDASTPQAEVLALVKRYNDDPAYHGILVQFPLPDHISQDKVLVNIKPEKDVDGLNPINFGKLIGSQPLFYPCTPAGIVEILVRNEVQIEGKHVVIVGRGNLVGKPLANMLVQKSKHGNATVTICHTKTPDLGYFTRQADILVAAIGSPRVIKAEMVKPGATVIDVGSNRVDNKVVGDVDFDAVKEVAGAITPVPGGVGPMTITMLLQNTLRSAERSLQK